MRYEDVEFIVTNVTSSRFKADGIPYLVNVSAKDGDDELVFTCPAESAPRVSEIVTMTFSWGDDE